MSDQPSCSSSSTMDELAEASSEPIPSQESTYLPRTWDFDGFIIESVYRTNRDQSDESSSEAKPEIDNAIVFGMNIEVREVVATETKDADVVSLESKDDDDIAIETGDEPDVAKKTGDSDDLTTETDDGDSVTTETEDSDDVTTETEDGDGVATGTEDGDDTSTVILDEAEISDMLKTINEIDQEAIAKTSDAVGAQAIEEPNNDGAAGLWAQDYQWPCFTSGVAIVQPTFQQIQVQQSSNYLGQSFERVGDMMMWPEDHISSKREITECSTCKRSIEAGRGVALKDCSHEFCRRCLVNAINDSETAVIMCPSKLVTCQGEVQQCEIKDLLNPEAFEKYNTEMLFKMKAYDLAEVYEHFEFVENNKDFRCGICTQVVKPGDGIVIKNCLHQYCKPCLARYIENSKGAVVNCPFRDEDGAVCIGILMDSEVRSMVALPIYLEIINRSIAEAEAANPLAYHCKTPDCKAWVEIEGQIQQFQCEACKKFNCVCCKAVHDGITCEAYQDVLNGRAR